MAYDTDHDIILLFGASNPTLNDTWAFHPSTQTWEQLAPSVSPPALQSYAEDLAYDPTDHAFVLHQGGEFWLYRYAASTDAMPPASVRDMVAH
jgi:hypothetical protein